VMEETEVIEDTEVAELTEDTEITEVHGFRRPGARARLSTTG
jgi:hypothetical protein